MGAVTDKLIGVNSIVSAAMIYNFMVHLKGFDKLFEDVLFLTFVALDIRVLG